MRRRADSKRIHRIAEVFYCAPACPLIESLVVPKSADRPPE
jgi:hypothetical protein